MVPVLVALRSGNQLTSTAANVTSGFPMLKTALRVMTDTVLIRPLRYIRLKTIVNPVERVSPLLDVMTTMHNNAIKDSVAYAEAHMQDAMAIEDKKGLWDYVLGVSPREGIYAEFGVWKGESINYIAKIDHLRQTTIFGFDSFEGLKDDWPGLGQARGHFSLGGELPKVESNVALIKGLFEQTLPAFLASDERPFAFVHVDCDTYGSTRTILNLIPDRLIPGTVVLFDEYFGYRGWRREEWKAWQDFTKANRIEYEYIAFSNAQVAVRVIQSQRSKM